MYFTDCPASTRNSIETAVSDGSTREIFRFQQKCNSCENMEDENTLLTHNPLRGDGDIYLSPRVNGNKVDLQTDMKCEDSPLTNACDESSTLRSCIVSFSSDEEDVTSDLDDLATPLDYRKDWSQEVKNTLKVFNASGMLVLDDDDDSNLRCESIASFDIDLDTRYELECQPLSEWIEDDEDIIW